MRHVVFRLDGGEAIGTGHVMRCLALAKGIDAAKITFICSADSKSLEKVIIAGGAEIKYITDSHSDAEDTIKIIDQLEKPDWLIVDHYSLEAIWESKVRPFVNNIMVIDDLANRTHDCDILLDQNYYADAKQRYDNLLKNNCTQLLGPSYALLREEFSNATKCTIKEEVKNILISFGGSDADDFTGKILNLLAAEEYKNISINVVMGAASTHKEAIEQISKQHENINFHCQIDYMAKLMSEADVFIGAGGSTSWERLALGLPAIIIAIADNQIELCENLAKANLIEYIGTSDDFTPELFKEILAKISMDFKWRQLASGNGKKIVDGRGVKKVAAYLKSFAIELLPAEEEHCEDVYKWRTAPENLEFSHNNNEFTLDSHEKWYKKIITSDDSDLLIAYKEDAPLGVVRFDYSDDRALISLYLVPGMHGKGWGFPLLLAANNWVVNNKPDVKEIKAEVIKKNIASKIIFFDAGYAQEDDLKEVILLVKVIDR